MSAPYTRPMSCEATDAAILAEDAAREQRILEEIFAERECSVRFTNQQTTIGDVLEIAAPLAAIGYAIELDWVHDTKQNIVGVTIHGVKGGAR